jgi:hypothetical protein
LSVDASVDARDGAVWGDAGRGDRACDSRLLLSVLPSVPQSSSGELAPALRRELPTITLNRDDKLDICGSQTIIWSPAHLATLRRHYLKACQEAALLKERAGAMNRLLLLRANINQ